MAYEVTCYKNTGFNAVNIPDTPALLDGMTSVTIPAIDLLQNRFLSSISVKATFNTVQDIDYCKVGDMYYIVTGVDMTSSDVAVLSLLPDFITTAGGAASLTYLDGITVRRTVPDDTLFAYTQPDDYLAPAMPLQMDYTTLMFDTPGGTDDKVLVESTIDLTKLSNQFTVDDSTSAITAYEGEGLVFSATDTGGTVTGESVTVPYTEGVGPSSVEQYTIGDILVKSPNTSQWDTSVDKVNLALGVVRALGVEGAIISQVRYPAGYFPTSAFSMSTATGRVAAIAGTDTSLYTGLAYKPAYTYVPKNNRIYYGEYVKYGILTAAGDKGEFLPEQIYNPSSEEGSPKVRVVADPRPTGKPYFRFEYYLGEQASSLSAFVISSVSGMQWANAPLTYQGASGTYMSRLEFSNARNKQLSTLYHENDTAYANLGQATTNFGINAIRGGINTAGALSQIGNPFSENFGGGGIASAANALLDVAQSASDYGFTVAGYQRDKQYRADQYALARQAEALRYAMGVYVVAPEVTFPFSADFIRDFVGNNAVVYHYKYSDADVERIDKLLTMYGYRTTEKLDATMFSARTYFDYVQATGVSVGGDLPMWMRSGIADQLAAGVRVWHVAPNPTYYTENPIRSTT